MSLNKSPKVWRRKCPKCKKPVFHVSKYTRDRYIEQGRTCSSCANAEEVTGRTFGDLTAIKRVKTNGKGRSATWLFKCVCQNLVKKDLHAVKKGSGDNCGCKTISKYHRTSGIVAYAWLFTKFKWACRNRKIKNALTLRDFLEFTTIDKCHYCYAHIYWAKHSTHCGKQPGNNGYHLDRKNTDIGYKKENCVVCCRRCNYGKGTSFTYEEWFGMTSYFRNLYSEMHAPLPTKFA